MDWGAGKMAFRAEHEMHKRRFGRNVGLGLVLVAFVALVFGLTVVKVTHGGQMQGFDHVRAAQRLLHRPTGGSQAMNADPKNRSTCLPVSPCLMVSLSFAAVPFYDWFCRVTGFGGTTSVAEAASDADLGPDRC